MEHIFNVVVQTTKIAIYFVTLNTSIQTLGEPSSLTMFHCGRFDAHAVKAPPSRPRRE